MRVRIHLIALLVVVLPMALAACGGGEASSQLPNGAERVAIDTFPSGIGRGYPQGLLDDEGPPELLETGAIPPEFTLLLPDGRHASISDLKGRPVLINFWATWCPPCRAEFPALLAAVKRHPGVRLVLVSADFDTATAQVRAFLRGHGVTDTTYLKRDSDQAFVDGMEPAWSGTLPATLVYDAAGNKVAFWEGAADSARFETSLVKALHASPTTEGTR